MHTTTGAMLIQRYLRRDELPRERKNNNVILNRWVVKGNRTIWVVLDFKQHIGLLWKERERGREAERDREREGERVGRHT